MENPDPEDPRFVTAMKLLNVETAHRLILKSRQKNLKQNKPIFKNIDLFYFKFSLKIQYLSLL